MITSSASLSEIARRVGFSDQSHFSRLFREAFGQTPARWRRDLESRGANEGHSHTELRSNRPNGSGKNKIV
jgi:AraC-like DNA-binding protein